MAERQDRPPLALRVARPLLNALAMFQEIMSARETGKRNRNGQRAETLGARIGRALQRFR